MRSIAELRNSSVGGETYWKNFTPASHGRAGARRLSACIHRFTRHCLLFYNPVPGDANKSGFPTTQGQCTRIGGRDHSASCQSTQEGSSESLRQIYNKRSESCSISTTGYNPG